jgi:hypothetical protein
MKLINVKNVNLRVLNNYRQDAKDNELKLVNTMKDLIIYKEPEKAIEKYGKGFNAYAAKKPKTFKLT